MSNPDYVYSIRTRQAAVSKAFKDFNSGKIATREELGQKLRAIVMELELKPTPVMDIPLFGGEDIA